MTRPLLALAVTAAASVVGVWIQATTHGASGPAQRPTALVGRAPGIPAATIGSPAAPVPDSRSLATALVARAGSPAPIAAGGARPAPATPSPVVHRLGAAVKIAADPATGQLIAPEHSGLALTVEEMQDLARREAEGLVTLRNPDGSETLNHEGRFTDYSVIRLGPDGRRVFRCVHGQFGVEHALRHAAPVTPIMEDR